MKGQKLADGFAGEVLLTCHSTELSSSSGSEDSSDIESDESSDDSEDFVSSMFMEEIQRQEEDEPEYLR